MPIFAWLVHAYTASGALLAFLSLRAAVAHEFRLAFAWLLLATLVDASDGWLARRARVHVTTPHVDGRKLDDIVDYLTFVFVPVAILAEAGLVPPTWTIVVAGAMLLSSAYGFAHEGAKTPDHFFTGFPSYWNIGVFYVYAARTPPLFNACLLLGLSVLVFVPIRYVYPSRTPVLRGWTLGLCTVWGAVLAWMILRLPDVPMPVLAGSLAFPIYYTVLSLVLMGRRRPS